ncbi:MAG TPA: hypothetical protein VMF89_37365, partial [Polyangiales bacterium]|nr:hypothetical protein [Polyangiales bacterium]
MHDEEGPRRLRQGADTPESLLRALTALRKGVDDSARLQRVGQKMEAVLASQPSAAQLSAGRGIFGQKLSTLKLIIGGLGLLAPLLFFQLMDDVTTVPSSDPEGSPLPSAAPQIAKNVEPDLVAPSATIPAVVNEAAAGAAAVSPNTKRSAKAGHAAATRPRKQRERSSVEAPGAEEPALAAKADEIEAPRTASADEPGVDPAPAPAVAPVPRPQPKPEAVQEAPRLSEAELLLKARQALKRDPELALRLASEHQSQYAKGRLTPEREVLAIEALRNLGRKAEADERLHKFE